MARNRLLPLVRLSSRPRPQKLACERALAELLRAVLAELVFTDAGLLMASIHAGKTDVIEDMLASCAERSLKPDALRYGGHALVRADWGEAPTVSLAMELTHAALTVYFSIVLDPNSVGVEIDSVLFHTPARAEEDFVATLSAALLETRIDG